MLPAATMITPSLDSPAPTMQCGYCFDAFDSTLTCHSLTGLYVVRLGLGGYDSGHLPDRTSTLNVMFSALLICYF